MKAAVFHPGTQHSWQTALALQQLGRLAWYATSIFRQPDRFPYSLERMLPAPLSERLEREFRRFSHPLLDPALVRTTGLAEWFERIAARAGLRGAAMRLDAFGNRRFAANIAADIRSPEPFALWGYNASSLGAFEIARQCDRACILDRTIGDFRYYNARMAELQGDYGDWLLPSERQMDDDLLDRDQREFELADAIVVGSPFAAATIRDHAGPDVAAKVRVLNYCYDELLFGGQPPPRPAAADEPVRFLFIGQVNVRKGIHHLLEAISRIPPAQATLTIVGDLRVPPKVFARYADRVTYVPTVARAEIPAIMADHHVLVFPSYFEGSALSLLEGLASGLALIQTPMSGCGVTPDTGLSIARPDTELLLGAMLDAISDRERLQRWRVSAQEEARNYTFDRYRTNVGKLLDDVLGPQV